MSALGATVVEGGGGKSGVGKIVGGVGGVVGVGVSGGAGQEISGGVSGGGLGAAIPFIDDSGSSSCTSSLLGDEEEEEDDTTSLSRLLDDAASRELSINGLHDELASLSCGYASLDAHSEEGASDHERGGRRARCDDRGSEDQGPKEREYRGSEVCEDRGCEYGNENRGGDKQDIVGEEQDRIHEDRDRISDDRDRIGENQGIADRGSNFRVRENCDDRGSEGDRSEDRGSDDGSHDKSRPNSVRWSWVQSSPGSHRTSKSSIKSTDNIDDEVKKIVNIDDEDYRPPPSLPPSLPPCETCEDRTSTSSSCFTSSSVLSCTTCAAESDAKGTESDTRAEEAVRRKSSSNSGPAEFSRQNSGAAEFNRSNSGNVAEFRRQNSGAAEFSRSNSGAGAEFRRQNSGGAEYNRQNSSGVSELNRPNSGSLADFNRRSMELGDPNYENAPLIVSPNAPPGMMVMGGCMPVRNVDGTLSNGQMMMMTPHRLSLHVKDWSPGALDTPIPLGSSTPQPGSSTGIYGSTDKGKEYARPHHYISSMRVASMRGAGDMGGALVARVATFLRTQYKNLDTTPLQLPWCPAFSMVVSDFETSLVQIPLAPHLKVPPGYFTLPYILHPHQLAFSEGSSLEERPRRVLVEGDPGYGKSTLALKLAYDWAANPTTSYLAQFSLVFVITLRDFRGGSLFSHLCKEILPRHILSKEAMSTLWNHLRKIEDKVLFILVGYDELIDEESGDLNDLLDGQMLPSATVITTSRPGCPRSLPPALHRRILVTGLSPDQTHRFFTRYFQAVNKPGSDNEVMSLMSASREKYGDLITCPVMCLALGVLYEDLGGKLPSRLTDLYTALLKHMVRRNLLRRGEPMCYDVLPDKYIKLLSDFGKVALEALKQNQPYFTGQDLKTKCQHGTEIIELGIVLRMQSTSKLTKRDHYTPVHKSLLEYLSAFYLSGLIHDPALLQTEIDGIAEKMDITYPDLRQNSGLNVLRYLVGLLGRNAHIIFNVVSQMGVPQRILFLLLKESGIYQMNVLEVCKHVSNREHVVIQTNSIELEDWARLLYSPDCTLEGVEVLLDFDGSSRDRHESFFTSMSFNESVKSVKLTCVVGGEFGRSEVTRLVSYVRAVLTKRRLESFEIQVTSVVEEAMAVVLSPVVEMICDTLPDLAPALNKLVLALELDADQVVQLCNILEEAPHVRVLHLPHLACGIVGLSAVAQLVERNPLVSLNLAGSLSSGTPVDERATGTGASTPSPTHEDAPTPSTSGPLAFWSFTDAQGNTRSVFNSLPRSFYQSLPRRGRLHSISADKRNSDSTLLQKTSFPPPACSPPVHANGFHEIFSAFRNPSSRVCHLNISKCTLGAEDLVCLGETIRFTRCLSSLRMEGLSRMAELIPILIALQENTSLQLLDLTSPHILLGDAALQVTLAALAKNRSLRFLVLNGWTIQVESKRSLRELTQFLARTELQHLDLVGCRVMVTIHEGNLARLSRQDDLLAALQEGVPALHNNTIAFLNLDGFEVTLNNKVVLRGPQLLFLLRHFPKLVDVSLASTLGADVIDDATTHRLFCILSSTFPFLRRLSLAGWVFSLDNTEKVMRSGGKQLRGSQLREVYLAGVEVRGSSGTPGLEHLLLQTLISSLHHLTLLSLAGMNLNPTQATSLAKHMRDKMAAQIIELETRGLSYATVKVLRQMLTDGGRFEVEFLGGAYKLRKVDRREKLIGKWACISTLDRLSEL